MPEPRDFRRLLSERVVVFDGATGTRLYDLGIFLNRCFDELNLSSPSTVEDVHRGYADVQVDVIETNTFGANRPKLEKHGLADQVGAINRAGAEIARNVAGDQILVAGAIGPLGLRIEPWGPTSVAEAAALFAEQAQALHEGGVDLLCLETFFDLAEVEAAVAGVRQVSDLPIVAQMTINDDGNSLEGVAPEVFGPKLEALDVEALGVNCSVGPAPMLLAVERLSAAVSKPIAVQPNAGKPRVVDNRNFYLCSPEYMAVYAKRMIEAGARIVGGCCGTTPDHLKAIIRAVRSVSPGRRISGVVEFKADERERAVDPVPFAQRSRITEALDQGRFAVFVEMLPPRGAELTRSLSGAARLAEAGVDAINIPDGPRASARMTPMALAVSIERQVGIETVVHYCCRDRNLLGMQSDLLGASALGLHNLLIITGDPPKLGDYPDATAVFDVDSIGLTNMVRRLNHGVDVGGNLDRRTDLVRHRRRGRSRCARPAEGDRPLRMEGGRRRRVRGDPAGLRSREPDPFPRADPARAHPGHRRHLAAGVVPQRRVHEQRGPRGARSAAGSRPDASHRHQGSVAGRRYRDRPRDAQRPVASRAGRADRSPFRALSYGDRRRRGDPRRSPHEAHRLT